MEEEQRRSVVDAVANLLQRWRFEGRVPTGQRFPSERELARRLRVGRSSVREALAVLKERGVLTVRQGDGIRSNSVDVGGNVRWLPHLFKQAPSRAAELLQLVAFFELHTAVLGEVFSLVADRGDLAELDRADRALSGVATAARYARHWYEAVREEMEAEFLVGGLAGNPALGLNLSTLWEFLSRNPEVAQHLRLEARLAEARRDRLVDALRTRHGENARQVARASYFAAHLASLGSFAGSDFRPRPIDEFAAEIGASPACPPPLGAGPLDREDKQAVAFDQPPGP